MNSIEVRTWRAAAFRRANASVALEGMHMTPEDLTLQKCVIDGELSSEQACQQVIKRARKREVAKRHAPKSRRRMRPEDSDPYVIRGTQVLKNLLGITDAAELDEADGSLSTFRAFELEEKPIEGAFDRVHLQRIHQELSHDVYDWAGKIRTTALLRSEYENGGRISRFVSPDQIERRSADIFRTLIQPDEFAKLDRDVALQHLASKWSEVNSLHPFREGNGRAIRVFFSQYMNEAGYSISFEPITKERWSRASIEAHFGSQSEIIKALSDATDIVAIERVQVVASIFDAMRRNRAFDWTERYISFPPPNHTVSGKIAIVTDDVFAMVSRGRVEIGSVHVLGSVPKVGEYVEYTEPDSERVFAKRSPLGLGQIDVSIARTSMTNEQSKTAIERLEDTPSTPSRRGPKWGF